MSQILVSFIMSQICSKLEKMQNSILVKTIFSSWNNFNWVKTVGFAFAEDSSFLFSAQIDYVIDAIDAVPQEMLDDQRVRIAAGIFYDFWFREFQIQSF